MNDFERRLLYSDGKTCLFFNVQAGFVLKSKRGTTMGVDLYLTDCVERFDGFKRLSPKVIESSIQLDYVLASHWHLDHFDIDAIPVLMSNRRTKLVCCEDCKEHVQNLKLDNDRVRYLHESETAICDDIIVHAVFCDHGTGAPLAIGFVFEIDGYKLYFAGDTALRLDKAPEIAKLGPFDVMLAPINGAFGNLNEVENVELCKYHRPKISVPCHFWTFAEQHGDPGIWAEQMKRVLPDQRYVVLAPGEKFILDEYCRGKRI